jgi:hypothetical protein
MEPSITVPIEAAPQDPVAALSIRVTGEEALTAARATGIGGHQRGPQVPDYYTQDADTGAQMLMGQDDELGPDAARCAQEYARWTWAED